MSKLQTTLPTSSNPGGLLTPTQDLVQWAINEVETVLDTTGGGPTLDVKIPAPVELGVSDVFTGTQQIAEAIRNQPTASDSPPASGAAATGTSGEEAETTTDVEREHAARDLYASKPHDFSEFTVRLPESAEEQALLLELVEQTQPRGGALDALKAAIGKRPRAVVQDTATLNGLREAVEPWENSNGRLLIWIYPHDRK